MALPRDSDKACPRDLVPCRVGNRHRGDPRPRQTIVEGTGRSATHGAKVFDIALSVAGRRGIGPVLVDHIATRRQRPVRGQLGSPDWPTQDRSDCNRILRRDGRVLKAAGEIRRLLTTWERDLTDHLRQRGRDGDLHDGIVGGMLGVHCGDSLGATYEFSAPNIGPPLRDIVGGGPFGWDPGDATDDTDLTICVARGYVALRRGDVKDDPEALARWVASELVGWKRSDPVDIGNTTARALASIEHGEDPLTAGLTSDRSAANGGLMRCLPTAMARADDVTRHRETALISSITHREPRCLDAAVAYNDIAHHLLAGRPPDEAIDRAVSMLAEREHDDRTRAAIADARRASAMPWDSGGYVLTSLAIAVWAVCQPRPAEAVLSEVCNAGGDADTNGAIAGGLLGVRHGASAWPTRWVDTLQRAAELRRLADDLLAVRKTA